MVPPESVVWTLIDQVSAVPAAAALVGLIKAGVELPRVTVIVVGEEIAELRVHWTKPEAGVIVQELQEVPLMLIFPEARPLKEKPEAEGEAGLLVLPTGKMILIKPPEGTAVTVLKVIVWVAVTGTITAAPLWWVLLVA